jgi:cytochrome c peroxidase
MFKTPSLRNVAARRVFFHNGQISRCATRFVCNTRDTRPEDWYPTVNGVVQKFNDLPRVSPEPGSPGAARQAAPGDPAMTDRDLDDLEASWRR